MKEPKDKAAELVSKFFFLTIPDAKKAAIVTIAEILDAIDWHAYESPNAEFEYWDKVLVELKSLYATT